MVPHASRVTYVNHDLQAQLRICVTEGRGGRGVAAALVGMAISIARS
jgi:hypothetical protein